MVNGSIIGVDLGGTNVRAGVVQQNNLVSLLSKGINSKGTADEVLNDLFTLIDELIHPAVEAIGIGMPGLIDEENQLVYDVINIPAWKEVPLQKWLQDRYQLPVLINNDANCFALGEFYFGKGKGQTSLIGVTVGTGIGSGIIINKKLYTGNNFGAGEFGMVDYLDHCYEYYGSGQFFKNRYQIEGELVYDAAKAGDEQALSMYSEMGKHLGNAIKMMLYAYDPSCIILGGSVSKAWPFFQSSMWQSIQTFAYQRSLKRLSIEVSTLQNSGVLGAAALWLNKEDAYS